MTLREALKSVDLDVVYKLINKKDQRNYAACDRPPMKQTIFGYSRVVNELLNKPFTKAYKYHWVVQESFDPLDKKKYADVCFLNPKYVAPKKGLKPWGGTRGKKIPKGHYDCNANKHNKNFACGFTPWSKIIDTPITKESKYSWEKAIAELLWELTFYGWTEEKVKVNVDDIKSKIDKATKEMKAGKYIEIPPRKKGGFKIVIPDIVQKQIKDAIVEESKKRK